MVLKAVAKYGEQILCVFRMAECHFMFCNFSIGHSWRLVNALAAKKSF